MYVTGTAKNAVELLKVIDTFLTTQLGDGNWKTMRREVLEYGGEIVPYECIWEGKGDGNDKIYLHMTLPFEFKDDKTSLLSINKIMLDSLAGYDEDLLYFEQAGSIQKTFNSVGQFNQPMPMFTCPNNEKFSYWLFGNSQRLIVVIKASTVYDSMYLGFINPISSERQYPYPMYIGGNSTMKGNSWGSNKNGSFIFPSDGSGYLRRADGSWRRFEAYGDSSTVPNPFSVGTLFPYNTGNQKLVPNYYEGAVGDLDNALMMPIILCTTQPYDVCGILDNVFFISGARDIASEQIMTFGSEQYIVFCVKSTTSPNTYFAVKLV